MLYRARKLCRQQAATLSIHILYKDALQTIYLADLDSRVTFDASRKPKRRESSFATIVCCVKLAHCIYVASLFIMEHPFEYMHKTTGGVRSAERGGETSRSPMACGCLGSAPRDCRCVAAQLYLLPAITLQETRHSDSRKKE